MTPTVVHLAGLYAARRRLRRGRRTVRAAMAAATIAALVALAGPGDIRAAGGALAAVALAAAAGTVLDRRLAANHAAIVDVLTGQAALR